MAINFFGTTKETEYIGKVVRISERNGYHDSDFYATYLHDDGTFRTDMYCTTRGASNGSADVDATPDVWKKWDEYKARLRRARLKEADEKHYKEGTGIYDWERGDIIEIYRGRKVPVGTVGECFYTRPQQWGLRIGLKDSDGNVFWTWGRNARKANVKRPEFK